MPYRCVSLTYRWPSKWLVLSPDYTLQVTWLHDTKTKCCLNNMNDIYMVCFRRRMFSTSVYTAELTIQYALLQNLNVTKPNSTECGLQNPKSHLAMPHLSVSVQNLHDNIFSWGIKLENAKSTLRSRVVLVCCRRR